MEKSTPPAERTTCREEDAALCRVGDRRKTPEDDTLHARGEDDDPERTGLQACVVDDESVEGTSSLYRGRVPGRRPNIEERITSIKE